MKPMHIAIDGPSGAGKSSISKAVAKRVGWIHVDTGAMYRAIGLYALRKNCLDAETMTAQIQNITIELQFIDGGQHVLLCGEDVTDKIHTPEVSMAASKVSAIPAVRAHLLSIQKKIAEAHAIIMDGRDIGTVILPNADLKIFLTASAEERARRRYLELQEKSSDCPPYEKILQDIQKRDENDMHRAEAPLRQAEDAVLVDSSDMQFDEVVAHILKLIMDRGMQ